MIGARDPFGLKPLCIGKRDNTYFLASESCAIAAVDGEFVRDVLPGEIVTITRKHGIQSDTSMVIDSEKQARCIFEYIYFARTDSTIDGVGVYHSRILAGKALAESYPVDADLVVGAPCRMWTMWPAFRTPVWWRPRDIRRLPVFRTAWHFTRTVMWEEHLSNRNRANVFPV